MGDELNHCGCGCPTPVVRRYLPNSSFFYYRGECNKCGNYSESALTHKEAAKLWNQENKR